MVIKCKDCGFEGPTNNNRCPMCKVGKVEIIQQKAEAPPKRFRCEDIVRGIIPRPPKEQLYLHQASC